MITSVRTMKHAILGPLVVAAALAGIAAAEAADEPENVIKYRQNVMRAITGHIGAIAGVIKGEVTYVKHIAAHARAMHATSMMIPDVFPPGSGVGETRAKPEIWKDWAKFEGVAKALQTETGELARITEGGDLAAIGAQLQKVGEACGGCHKPFRKEKK